MSGLRLWSISPSYLDARGLLALWREALLAQKVLMGLTRGYAKHPQLERFRRTSDPVLYIGTYLYYVYLEGRRRGYDFNLNKIVRYDPGLPRVPVTSGQVRYEFQHLLDKLRARDPARYEALKGEAEVKVHPLFYVVEATWSRGRGLRPPSSASVCP